MNQNKTSKSATTNYYVIQYFPDVTVQNTFTRAWINRVDFSFIAGGIVPAILILKPDFPENKEDWGFFWGDLWFSAVLKQIFLPQGFFTLIKRWNHFYSIDEIEGNPLLVKSSPDPGQWQAEIRCYWSVVINCAKKNLNLTNFVN